YSAFESEAAFIAEREIELLKADLLSRQRKPGPAATPSRFRNRPGVKVNIAWTGCDPEGTVRMLCTVSQLDRIFKIESFLYLPQEPGS
ncbi:MAG: hypothetical protein AB1403_17640, partial [Candidatus Riflebacteria bacterium]